MSNSIVEINENDVLSGRGGKINSHPGNVQFRNVVAPSADMPSSFYPLNLDQAQVDQIWDLGVQDGTAAATDSASTKDLTHFFSLKKKNDSRLMGGVSFD